ncbi:MAG: hypothetical protein FJY55_11515, partial [Betaproteobacteria bacterium]|nr:hypothetical protein [Betaproteobacteria bacterium]
MAPDPETTEPTFDMDAAVASVADGLFGEDGGAENPTGDTAPASEGKEAAPAPTESKPAEGADKAPEATKGRAAPKSWAQDKHEVWAKMPPEAQDYYLQREEQMHQGLTQYKGDAEFGKSLRDVFAPYKTLLQGANLNEAQAAQWLMAAHAKLSTAPVAERASYFADLARQYGIDLGAVTQQVANPVDSHVKGLQERLDMLQNTITAREQAALQDAQQAAAKEVEAFAADPAHPYFDEVADDIVAMLKAGAKLADAYEKAVWANPVTRAKEISRLQTEQEKKIRENIRLDGLKAKTAAGATVRSRDTNAAPTEPLGTMEDTMRSTMAAIRSR